MGWFYFFKTFDNLISESLENLSSYWYKRSENCSAVIHTLDLWAGKKWTTTHLQGELLSHKTITIVNTLSLSIQFRTNKVEEYPQAVAWVRLCRVITQINPTQTGAFWCIPSLSHVIRWLCVQVDLTETHCESNLLPWHPIIYGCSIGSYNFVQTCWSPTSNFLGWKLSTRCMKHRP
jgi:hypothetical protein